MSREPLDLVEFMSIVIWLVGSYLIGAVKFYEFVTCKDSGLYYKEDRIKALIEFIFSPIVIPVLVVMKFIRWINHG